MFNILLTMSIVIFCGSLWRYFSPTEDSVSHYKKALTSTVFYLFLPALIIDVIWQAPIQSTAGPILITASMTLFIGMLLSFISVKWITKDRSQQGVIILASTFPNATYLGLPILSQVIGEQAKSTAIQYDFLVCTPVLLSLGIIIAQRYGQHNRPITRKERWLVPPLWAVVIGIGCNGFAIPKPTILENALTTLAMAVVPLMLIVLGMSIRWQWPRMNEIIGLAFISVMTLLLAPSLALFFGQPSGASAQLQLEMVLVAAMPTMVFGIVLSERYGLDTHFYASAVTLTSVLSLLSLPFWYGYLL